MTIVAASLDPGERLAVADRDVVLALPEGFLLDLAPDGRFLVAVPFRDGGAGTKGRLVAVTNWFTRLRERMAP